MPLNNYNNFSAASNQFNHNKKQKENQSVLNNSRSKSKNNENPSQNPNSSTNLKTSNSNNISSINQLKSSNSVNNFAETKVFKKHYMKETTGFLKKEYSTSINENNIASNYIKNEKQRGFHISAKSINIIDKNHLDSLSNLGASHSPHVQFKKYSVSPNQKNPLESIVAENSDFFEEDNFDPISYREKYLNETGNNYNNYNNNNTGINQKITVRTSNTNANVNTIGNNLLITNQLKSLKSESKLLSNNNNQISGIYSNTKKTAVKRILNINNNNNYDPNPGHLVSSVKNSNNNKNSIINGSGSNFYQKNSNKILNVKDSKDQSRINQNPNLNVKTNKYKNFNSVRNFYYNKFNSNQTKN
jgi:hypothetical protein